MPRPRHQVNISLSPEQHQVLKDAADVEGITLARFVRNAALDAAQPLEGPEMGASFPAWLIALLTIFRTGHRSQTSGK